MQEIIFQVVVDDLVHPCDVLFHTFGLEIPRLAHQLMMADDHVPDGIQTALFHGRTGEYLGFPTRILRREQTHRIGVLPGPPFDSW